MREVYLIAACLFLFSVVSGWVWARVLGRVVSRKAENDQFKEEVNQRVRAINELAREMGAEIERLQAPVAQAHAETIRQLDEMAAQVRVLAVNGSIEAAKSPEAYRSFHVILQEINQLATQSRELLKKLGSTKPEGGASEANGARSPSSSRHAG